MSKLSALERKHSVEQLKNTEYDLLVIGGGITGAGIALDAASRGLKTALVERDDFASGTSSRSTKLIHGGLRYLKQFEIALVREVGRERAIVHKNAPHLVPSERMLLPLIKDGTFGKFTTSVGLMVYDVLAGVESADQRKMLSKEEAFEKEPLLDESVLEGGGIYAEYRTDDARLTIEVIKTAIQHGADCLNYVSAIDFIYDNGKVAGVKAMDHLAEKDFEIKAKYVTSAAGPWVDELRDKNHSLSGKRLHLTKGVHIVVPKSKFPLRQAIYFDVPDGRMIFAIPRGLITYIGTTDTDYTGDKNRILTNTQDINYLLDAANSAFPSINLKIKDVVSSWAGVRPLIHEEGKSASEISRKDEIFESETGLLSIAGGKLTGFRKMAEKIVDVVVKKFKMSHPETSLSSCTTHKIALTGGVFSGAKEVKVFKCSLEKRLQQYGFDEYVAFYLVSNYGKQADSILAIYDSLEDHNIYERFIKAECEFDIQNEMVYNLRDFFIRRTGRLYFDIDSVKYLQDTVADYMANKFGWSEAVKNKELDLLQQEILDVSKFENVQS
ncbi:MAG: glycerol-3-phosphate dehydrogenase/oxidase [Bacteroidota bacterium]